MNKEEFNKLSIEHQVQNINQLLLESSLTKVCEILDINRATIRKRFKKFNYELVDNQYVITTDVTTVTTDNKKAIEKSKDSIDTNTLLKRIEVLERQIEDINNRLATTDITTITTSDFKTYTNNAIARNYRVDADIQQQFKLFCNKHKEHRVSDILSQALEEFLYKHNK